LTRLSTLNTVRESYVFDADTHEGSPICRMTMLEYLDNAHAAHVQRLSDLRMNSAHTGYEGIVRWQEAVANQIFALVEERPERQEF